VTESGPARNSLKAVFGTVRSLLFGRLELDPNASKTVRRVGRDLDRMRPLGRQAQCPRQPRIDASVF
jgi:hypothetical protein